MNSRNVTYLDELLSLGHDGARAMDIEESELRITITFRNIPTNMDMIFLAVIQAMGDAAEQKLNQAIADDMEARRRNIP